MLYAVWAETGYLKENELLNLRKVDSILEGHPVPVRSQWDPAIFTNQQHNTRVYCLKESFQLNVYQRADILENNYVINVQAVRVLFLVLKCSNTL